VTTPLLKRWHALFPADTTVGAALLARWAEPQRHYHTTAHLAALLSIVDEHAALAEDPDAVRLAVWYHDAVYDPRAADNEAASADLAREQLHELGVHADRVAEVARLVLLTAGHRVEPGDRNGALLADADLAILASPPERYDAYARAVRAEYAHVPDELFRAGRSHVLEHLLALPALYRIVPDRADWERAARANLDRELGTLQAPSP
jgi:predicted metal-dependent HD superfamily phosphohydrolase